MENKKNNVIVSLALIIIGAAIGYSFAITGNSRLAVMHQMPDGTMMRDDGGMSGMMMDMNAALRGKTGDELDKAFLQEMIVHHQGAIEMADILLAGGKHPELKLLAQNIIEAQNPEITMMRQWLKAWYNM